MSLDRALAVGGLVITLLLIVLDKAGKLKGPALLILLAIAAAMTLPLAFGVPWVSKTPSGQAHFARGMVALFAVGLAYSLIASWISGGNAEEVTKALEAPNAPIKSNSSDSHSLSPMISDRPVEQPRNSQKPVSPEAMQWPSFMELAGVIPADGYATISPGMQLKFNIVYMNKGTLPLHGIYMIESIAIVDLNDRDEAKLEMLFSDAIKKELDRSRVQNYRGGSAGVGRQLNHPFTMNPLTTEDATGILEGSRILYLSTYVEWIDINGHPGKEQNCYWMEKPKSSVLTDQQIWNNCLK